MLTMNSYIKHLFYEFLSNNLHEYNLMLSYQILSLIINKNANVSTAITQVSLHQWKQELS